MTAKKTTTLNLRIDPVLKEALRNASIRDHRSLANMVEVLILKYCTKDMAKNDGNDLYDELKNQ
jgi:hypothetical protein